MIRRALVVGGASGIGLSIAVELASRASTEIVYVVDRSELDPAYKGTKVRNFVFDLNQEDYSFFDRFTDIDALIITAGFGRLALFKDIDEQHIIDSFNVNTVAVIRLIRKFYDRISSKDDFYCTVMGSISGFMSSPFFAVYGATKAALKIFIESVNVELIKSGTTNRILNVSPGSIKGTGFYKGQTDLSMTAQLAKDILSHTIAKDDLYIPLYEEVFKTVLQRYQDDFRAEGIHSYEYKEQSKR